jgi:crotonobetainyl-CoA:carnitine CoA-transferase CaiB-like acyl-CoA transferase
VSDKFGEGGPLTGLRVLDVGQVIAGPLIAQLMGDLGADVIKVEPPGDGDAFRRYGPTKNGVPLGWKVAARNKRSVCINLRKPDGVELLKSLFPHVDVIITSFRPSTSQRFGLTPDDVASLNPRAILIQVSGFGQDGPYADRPGFGTLAEAMSGFAELTGQAEDPPTLPMIPLADSVAALFGVIGALSALRWRDQHGGPGQAIDLSLMEPLASILGPLPTYFDQAGILLSRMGSRNGINAPRNVYRTIDGKWLAIAASVPAVVQRCFELMGLGWMLDDPRFATAEARVRNVDEVDRLVGGWVGERTRDAALEALIEAGVAAAPVLDTAEYMEDPQVIARESIVTVQDDELGDIKMHRVLPRLSSTPGAVRRAGPRLGEHTDEVLMEILGLSSDEVGELRQNNIV